MPHLLTYLDIH